MMIRKTSLAALLGALPLLAFSPAHGAIPLMNGPAVQSPQALSTLLGELGARRARTEDRG